MSRHKKHRLGAILSAIALAGAVGAFISALIRHEHSETLLLVWIGIAGGWMVLDLVSEAKKARKS